MVSADLSGMGKASGQPVRWSIMVNMCLLPEVDVLQSVTKSMAILSNGLSGISVNCKGYCWTLALSHLQRMQFAIYFLMSLFIPFQQYWYLIRQYVWLFPWCPSLSWASTRMVNFHDLGMTRARNCLPASDTCLYRSPFTWVKVSNLLCGALPFSSLLEMHLQKGSILCICSKASHQSAVNDFGVGVSSWDMCGVGVTGGAEVGSEILWVWLLVWKAGLSFREAVSMLIDMPVGEPTWRGSLLPYFWLQRSIQRWYCRWQVPNSTCLPYYLCSCC